MFELLLNEQKKETTIHGNSCFPFAIYRGPVSAFASGALEWHWHEDFEFNLVTCGELDYQVEKEVFHLRQGESIFINSQRLHKSLSCTADEYSHTITFHGKLLCEDLFSDWYRQIICPLIHSRTNALKISSASSWESAVLSHLVQACAEETAGYPGYELSVKSHILAAFSEILKQHSTLLSGMQKNHKKQERIKQLLNYIHQNYQNAITLADLAAFAGLSEGECSRFFKKQLNQSPFSYLNEYRIKKSCDSLVETDLSISEIAVQSGFNSFSYYSRRFYEMMQCTPAEYRKKIREAKRAQNRSDTSDC